VCLLDIEILAEHANYEDSRHMFQLRNSAMDFEAKQMPCEPPEGMRRSYL